MRYAFSFTKQMAQRVNMKAHPSQLDLPTVESKVLLELFPFALILDKEMRISCAGEKIVETWILQNPNKPPHIFIGSYVMDNFKLRRPKGIVFNWTTVTQMRLVIFELELVRMEAKSKSNELLRNATTSRNDQESSSTIMDRRGSQGLTRVLLKGQMRYIDDIDSIIFLCSPLYVLLNCNEHEHIYYIN